MPTIIPRNEWDTVPATNAVRWSIDRLDGGGVHWFGIPDGSRDHARCDDIARSVRAGHKSGQFNDIAYNHLICPHGVIYEARGFYYQTGANGYQDVNRRYYAIAVMLGKNNPPSMFNETVKESLRWLIHEWQKRGAGEAVKWHGYWTGSECPGDAIRAWVKANLWRIEPPTPPTPPPPKEDQMHDMLNWLDDFVTWRIVHQGDPAKRPAIVPDFNTLSAAERELAWGFVATCQSISVNQGMSLAEEEFINWRLVEGAAPEKRPQLPERIPQPWWDDATKMHKIATAYAERR